MQRESFGGVGKNIAGESSPLVYIWRVFNDFAYTACCPLRIVKCNWKRLKVAGNLLCKCKRKCRHNYICVFQRARKNKRPVTNWRMSVTDNWGAAEI